MPKPYPWRRILAIVVALAIFALRIDRRLITLPLLSRPPIAAALTRLPDRFWPQYPRFLAGVREHTVNGDTIIIVVPILDWENGYSYAFYRASYFLAGRVVLPVATADRRLHPELFRSAKYVAAWGGELPLGHRTVVWQGEGGVLSRR